MTEPTPAIGATHLASQPTISQLLLRTNNIQTSIDHTTRHAGNRIQQVTLSTAKRSSFPPTRLVSATALHNSSMCHNEEERRNDLRWRSTFSG